MVSEEESKANIRKILAKFGDKQAREEEEQEENQKQAQQRYKVYLRNRRKASRLNPYQIQKKAIKDRRQEQAYEYNKRVQSPSVIAKAFAYARNPKKELLKKSYGSRYYEKEKSAKQKFQEARLRAIQQQAQLIRAKQQAEQRHFDWVFSNFTPNGNNIPMQLEREIMQQGNGAGNIGDSVAFGLDREASFHGNNMTSTILPDVDREASFHAQTMVNLPIINMENEVWSFANMLNPQNVKRKTIPRKTKR